MRISWFVLAVLAVVALIPQAHAQSSDRPERAAAIAAKAIEKTELRLEALQVSAEPAKQQVDKHRQLRSQRLIESAQRWIDQARDEMGRRPERVERRLQQAERSMKTAEKLLGIEPEVAE